MGIPGDRWVTPSPLVRKAFVQAWSRSGTPGGPSRGARLKLGHTGETVECICILATKYLEKHCCAKYQLVRAELSSRLIVCRPSLGESLCVPCVGLGTHGHQPFRQPEHTGKSPSTQGQSLSTQEQKRGEREHTGAHRLRGTGKPSFFPSWSASLKISLR